VPENHTDSQPWMGGGPNGELPKKTFSFVAGLGGPDGRTLVKKLEFYARESHVGPRNWWVADHGRLAKKGKGKKMSITGVHCGKQRDESLEKKTGKQLEKKGTLRTLN